MAAIEITTPLIGMTVAWFTSSLVATWALSRRSRNWDYAEDHEETLWGNRRENKPGLVQRVTATEDAVSELAKHFKHLINALEAHGSGEHQVSEGVRRKIREHAMAAYEEIVKARKAIISEQTGRYSTIRSEASYVEATSEDSTPHLPPPRKR